MRTECFTPADKALVASVSRRVFQFYFINLEHAACQQEVARATQLRRDGVAVLRVPGAYPAAICIFQANVQAIAFILQIVRIGQLLQEWRYIRRNVGCACMAASSLAISAAGEQNPSCSTICQVYAVAHTLQERLPIEQDQFGIGGFHALLYAFQIRNQVKRKRPQQHTRQGCDAAALMSLMSAALCQCRSCQIMC